MLAGTAAVTVVWWQDLAAWTWYSAIGAAITGGVALVLSPFEASPSGADG